MSEENVEVALAAAAAWREGDIEALMRVYSPDIAMDFSHYAGWPEEPVLHGPEAVRGFLEQWRATFTDYGYEVERHIDAGDRVVFLCTQRGRGQASDSPALMEFAQINTVRDGHVTRIENFSDRAEALEAVGLQE
jgi:ketosteroid isomerase-like protein